MDLKRRDFLKGLMAIAGVAVVGLPPVEDSPLIADVEQFLASGGEPAHPTGPFGSIRIGDRWYALYSASLGVHQNVRTYPDGHDMIVVPTSRSWGIDCELDTMDGLDAFNGESYPIEIAMHGRTFSGNAYLTATGGSVSPRGDVRYALEFEGVGPLTYA